MTNSRARPGINFTGQVSSVSLGAGWLPARGHISPTSFDELQAMTPDNVFVKGALTCDSKLKVVSKMVFSAGDDIRSQLCTFYKVSRPSIVDVLKAMLNKGGGVHCRSTSTRWTFSTSVSSSGQLALWLWVFYQTGLWCACCPTSGTSLAHN